MGVREQIIVDGEALAASILPTTIFIALPPVMADLGGIAEEPLVP